MGISHRAHSYLIFGIHNWKMQWNVFGVLKAHSLGIIYTIARIFFVCCVLDDCIQSGLMMIIVVWEARWSVRLPSSCNCCPDPSSWHGQSWVKTQGAIAAAIQKGWCKEILSYFKKYKFSIWIFIIGFFFFFYWRWILCCWFGVCRLLLEFCWCADEVFDQ